MLKFKVLLLTVMLTLCSSVTAGDFKVDGVSVGDSSAIRYVTTNLKRDVLKIVTDGSVHMNRIDDTVDIPGENQQTLVVDDVVIGSSELIPFYFIDPNNNNIRLVTNGNLNVVVDQPARNPQITLFKADNSTISVGEQLTLSWQSTDTDYCVAEADFDLTGQLAVNDSHAFTVDTVGTFNYGLKCIAELNGQTFEDSSSVSVTVEEAISNGDDGIHSFTATSTTIEAGEPITLSWTSSGVNFCQGTADFRLGTETDTMPINSSKTFNESRTGVRTYGLKCIGAETYTKTLNVQVLSGNGSGTDPKIRTLSSSKAQPLVGENFLLNWDAINVDTCTASGAWVGSKTTSGQQAISYASAGSRTFNLDCTQSSSGITVSKSVTVNVVTEIVGAELQIASFVATPNPVAVGTDLTLNWTTGNAVSCKGISPGISDWITPILSKNGSINIRITEAGEKTFVLRCFDNSFPAKSVEASVIVATTGAAQEEVFTFLSANKTSIIDGEEVTFTWSSSNATACTTQGVAFGWSGKTLATSGTMVFTPRHDSMSAVYGVECTNVTSSTRAEVNVFSSLPDQALGANNCAVPFTTMDVVTWNSAWGGAWPNDNGLEFSVPQGRNLAVKFNSGSTAGVSTSIIGAPVIGSTGVHTVSYTQCPGDYTYGETGVPGQKPLDSDCIETWGLPSVMKTIVSDTYVEGNGICELASGTDYYMNLRFSSACTQTNCRGVLQHAVN